MMGRQHYRAVLRKIKLNAVPTGDYGDTKETPMSVRASLAIVLGSGLLFAQPAEAQFLKDLVKRGADKVEREVEREIDRSLDRGIGAVGSANVPDLLQARWGLSEAHCMQSEVLAPGIVLIDAQSIYLDGTRGLFGAPSAVGKTFMRASANYVTESGPRQRDFSFHVRGRRVMQYTEFSDYGSRKSDTYVRCRPMPAPPLL